MESKICPGCGIEKLFSEYYRDNSRKNKINGYCKECRRKQAKNYDDNNNKKVINMKKRERRKINIYYKLYSNLNKLIYEKYKIKRDGLLWYYIGCSPKFLVKYFEYLGCDYLMKEYVIDHIRPRCVFNFDNIEERYLCHNWKNLRLISNIENISKRNKIDSELIQFYLVIADVFLEDNKNHIIFYEFLYDWID